MQKYDFYREVKEFIIKDFGTTRLKNQVGEEFSNEKRTECGVKGPRFLIDSSSSTTCYPNLMLFLMYKLKVAKL